MKWILAFCAGVLLLPLTMRAATTDPNAVYTEPQVGKPPYRLPTLDPTLHSQVMRIANDPGLPTIPVSGTWGTDARHTYSKQQPWNSDQSLIVIDNRGGSPAPLFLDGNTYLPIFGECPSSPLYDYRWHPSLSHANEMVNVNSSGTELSWYDVVDCTKRRSWTLPITSNYGVGSGEGNTSNDGRFVAIGNNTQMLVVDMDPQPPLAPYPNKRIGPARTISDCGLSGCTIDWVSVSASGKYAVVNYSGDYPRVFDIDPNTLALTPHVYPAGTPECLSHDPANGFITDLGHADFTLDADGADVLIGQHSSGCPSIGGVVKVRLSDGLVTPLTNPSNEAFPHHISTRSLNRPGWVYVSYYSEPGKRFSDEVVAVRTDGSLGVERLAHIHSVTSGCYRCEPHAVPSPNGNQVIFASNWAMNCSPLCGSASVIDDYVITDELVTAVSAQPPLPHISREAWYDVAGRKLSNAPTQRGIYFVRKPGQQTRRVVILN